MMSFIRPSYPATAAVHDIGDSALNRCSMRGATATADQHRAHTDPSSG